MRDGNSIANDRCLQRHRVFSLPMRDGNPADNDADDR